MSNILVHVLTCMSFYNALLIIQVITLDFLIVPLVLTVGGILTLLISIFGLVAVAREVIPT